MDYGDMGGKNVVGSGGTGPGWGEGGSSRRRGWIGEAYLWREEAEYCVTRDMDEQISN